MVVAGARDRATRVSKYLALRLRHRPGDIGLTLDEHGWIYVEDLLAAAGAYGFPIDRAELAAVVATNDKRRFELDGAGRRIRARQGHSMPVELGLQPSTPPELLFHGTVRRSLGPILQEGLRPMGRQHVHLSPDEEAAEAVGRRRGHSVVLGVCAGAMHDRGHLFWLTANGVWLTAHVPVAYLSRRDLR